MFGYDETEFSELSLDALVPDHIRDRHAALAHSFRAQTKSRQMGSAGLNIQGRRADGGLFPADISLLSVDDGLVYCVVRDVSAYRLLENQLREESDRLSKALVAAQEAVRVKSEFLATMSHEIRTPLNGIIGMTSLLLDSELDPEIREFVDTIRLSGDTLLTVLNDILDFSKIEAGRTELEVAPFELDRVVADALDIANQAAIGKRLELTSFITLETPAAVYGDVARFRQIVINLVSNAVKFTDQGEVAVTVDVGPLEADTITLRLAVSDTGIGIPENRLSDVFDSFVQADGSVTRKWGGTGLGLAISSRLAELMGGKIWVESEVNKGSTFHLEVPFRIAEASRAPSPRSEGALSGLKLLIVDDNATQRDVLALHATAWGMEPVSAENARQALDIVQSGQSFDLALLDLHMPEVSGLELAERLVDGWETPFKLILMSSVADRLPLRASLFAEVVHKPIKPDKLCRALQRAAGREVADENTEPDYDRAAGSFRRMRILVAEDNQSSQQVTRKLAQDLGHSVDLVSDGIEALDALSIVPYQIILMDVQMPEMNGIEATRLIRERFQGAYRPYIVAMAANAMAGDWDKYLKAGMDDYISGPVTRESLAGALARFAESTRD